MKTDTLQISVSARMNTPRLLSSPMSTFFDYFSKTNITAGARREDGYTDPLAFDLEFLAEGLLCIVFHCQWQDRDKVFKVPRTHDVDKKTIRCQQLMDHEAAVYLRAGPHPSLVQYLGRETIDGVEGHMLRFCPNGSIEDYLYKLEFPVAFNRQFRWCVQIAEGIAHLHSRGIIHVETHPKNILLDKECNAKLCNFNGSRMQGSSTNAKPRPAYRRKLLSGNEWNEETDIFAMGSTFYHIFAEMDPHADQTTKEEELEALFAENKYPDVSCVPVIGNVIMGCWTGRFKSANVVLRALHSCMNQVKELESQFPMGFVDIYNIVANVEDEVEGEGD